jgi:hypothetical protein
MEGRICRGLPFIAVLLVTLPLFTASAQTSPRISVQSYTWLTAPASQYADPQNNLLTNRQPGNPSQIANGGWVGHLDSARVVFRLAAPRMVDFFSIQILEHHASGIKAPNKVFFTCFNDSGSTTAEILIQARRQGGAFEIGNSTRLRQTCKEVALNIVAGAGDWVFLGEVSFFAALDVKQAKSLFLEVSTLGALPEQELRAWLQKAANDPQIENLTLAGVARTTQPGVVALLTDKLDIIDDYFSGFDNIFVGFMGLQNIVSDPYETGILSPEIRWRNIYETREALRLFRNRYPSLSFHYYLDYEANLNDFVREDLREAHLAMNIVLINDFREARPDGVILWSPTFWTPYSQLAAPSELQSALTSYFSRLKQGTNGVGVQWLDFQDFVGQSYLSSTPMTYEDVKNYRALLARSHAFASLRINMECFRPTNDATEPFAPMPGFELASRQAFYAENNLTLGMAWEMRHWYRSEGQW